MAEQSLLSPRIAGKCFSSCGRRAFKEHGEHGKNCIDSLSVSCQIGSTKEMDRYSPVYLTRTDIHLLCDKQKQATHGAYSRLDSMCRHRSPGISLIMDLWKRSAIDCPGLCTGIRPEDCKETLDLPQCTKVYWKAHLMSLAEESEEMYALISIQSL